MVHKKQFKKTHSESGRSLLEALGVLAIMAIISAGGIIGYSAAMRKHYANDLLDRLMKRAMDASTQAMTGGTPDLSNWPNDGKYVIDPNVQTDASTFTLLVHDVPTDICEQINILNWPLATITPEAGSCWESADMTFEFNKDLKPRGAGDSSGNGNGEEGGNEETNACTPYEGDPCIASCSVVDEQVSLTYAEGATCGTNMVCNDSGTCGCKTGYFFTASNGCVACDDPNAYVSNDCASCTNRTSNGVCELSTCPTNTFRTLSRACVDCEDTELQNVPSDTQCNGCTNRLYTSIDSTHGECSFVCPRHQFMAGGQRISNNTSTSAQTACVSCWAEDTWTVACRPTGACPMRDTYQQNNPSITMCGLHRGSSINNQPAFTDITGETHYCHRNYDGIIIATNPRCQACTGSDARVWEQIIPADNSIYQPAIGVCSFKCDYDNRFFPQKSITA